MSVSHFWRWVNSWKEDRSSWIIYQVIGFEEIPFDIVTYCSPVLFFTSFIIFFHNTYFISINMCCVLCIHIHIWKYKWLLLLYNGAVYRGCMNVHIFEYIFPWLVNNMSCEIFQSIIYSQVYFRDWCCARQFKNKNCEKMKLIYILLHRRWSDKNVFQIINEVMIMYVYSAWILFYQLKKRGCAICRFREFCMCHVS